MSAKLKCPICNSRASPHRRGEALRAFPNALCALSLGPSVQAHPSCLINLLRAITRARAKKGYPTPVSNQNPSSLLHKLESHNP
jgi:hypothetical protein